ncbi:N-6 DNA methylase [Streptomyces sp. NPDC017890]|uniref:N-6 DNA methylase n=1 Tax=Streptomyces sp. NPDC017890 TaxID=3365015 RepID=UPI0037A5FBD1
MAMRARCGGPGFTDAPLPRLLGQTPKRTTLPLANMNLALRGVRPALRLKTGGRPWEQPWLQGPVDLVLTNPPFNMQAPGRAHRRPAGRTRDRPGVSGAPPRSRPRRSV